MIQKKYISPSVEITTVDMSDGVMITVSGEVSTEPQLVKEGLVDFDPDEEGWGWEW